MNTIKTLMRSVKQYKRDSILTPVYIIFEVAMEVTLPLLMSSLIDDGIDAGNMNYILKIGAALVAAALISLVFGTLAGRTSARASAGFARNLRQDMYYNIQDFSFSNIDKFSTSSLVTRLTTDVTNVQFSYMVIIRMAVRAPIMMFFSLGMSFSINRSLSLFFLAAVPVLGVGLFTIISKVHPRFERIFRTYDKLNNVVQENLRGIRVVKSFVREEYEKEKFNNISEIIFQDFTKAEKTIAFNMPLMQFSMYSCILFISWFGARMIVSDSMTTGQLTSFFTYALQILMSLMMLSMVFVMIIISRASAKRIAEVLQETSDLHNADNPVMNVPDGSVCFENVNFSYVGDKNKLCLTDINLDIKSGETVGIIGGTGSGKSSLVQLIPRLYDITDGRLLVGGIPVGDIDLFSLRESVAMILQKNVLFSGTIKENLLWGNSNASDEELRRVCTLARADEFIRDFPDGYETHIEQGGTNLSGGQKQRLCIARTLLKKPKILIMDDSTSAVDTKTDSQIRKAFREEIPETTKLIIAQRISSVEDADKIVVMDNGKISAVGSHEELMSKSTIYREVYESQVKGGRSDETR
ncbi:MAG: ABC transporter ATP-binding protein/permease [Lachnoclostridium sp.]|jgi:ATP-binding cassette subfamily B protein|nr:ABC transporter ATP-binding protein/permease [Lachnoclostridium sp.]